jgi:hypothetical protein
MPVLVNGNIQDAMKTLHTDNKETEKKDNPNGN